VQLVTLLWLAVLMLVLLLVGMHVGVRALLMAAVWQRE
jgi:hypothetical protein